jgi:hypothetical protein
MKKGQTETMGLMVIVILLVFVGLIALSFMLKSSPNNQDSFLSNKANNMANSIKNADLCSGTFEEAIVACCKKENFCETESCKLVSEQISNITGQSDEQVYVEAKDYDGKLCFSTGACENGISSSSYVFDNGVSFKVVVCRK